MKKLSSLMSISIIVATLIASLSIAYYLIIFLPEYKLNQLELLRATVSIDVPQSTNTKILAPTTVSDAKIPQPDSTNSQLVSNCSKEAKAFEKIAISQGYTQNEYQGYVDLIIAKCKR